MSSGIAGSEVAEAAESEELRLQLGIFRRGYVQVLWSDFSDIFQFTFAWADDGTQRKFQLIANYDIPLWN